MSRSRLAWAIVLGGLALVAVGAAVRRIRHRQVEADAADERVTEASRESFPASDPPSFTPTSGPRL